MQNVTPFNYIRNNSTPQWWLGRTYLVKGVIEIIFIDEILAKFLYAVKMIAVAPHHRFVQPSLATYISFGVGYCFIQQQRQCEKPHQ